MDRRPDGLGGPLVIVVVAIVIAGMAFAAGIVSWILMATFFAILVWPLHAWLLRSGIPSVVLVSFSFWTWLLGGSGALLSVFLTILAIVIFDSFDRTRWLAGIMTVGAADSSETVEQVPTGAAVDGKTPA